MSSPSRWSHPILLAFFAAASLFLNVAFVRVAIRTHSAFTAARTQSSVNNPLAHYSYIGNDYPSLLPVFRRPVYMAVEESVHYSLTDPEANLEWLFTAPLGDNHIRLGPEYRSFAVAMYHELHCLRGLRDSLDKGYDHLAKAGVEHIHHCFNYLRQWTLCDADVTLEPGDFTTRNFTIERAGATHICPDWEPSYRELGAKWAAWQDYKESHPNEFANVVDVEP